MNIIIKTPMSYKTYYKKGDVLVARIQIIQQKIYAKKKI